MLQKYAPIVNWLKTIKLASGIQSMLKETVGVNYRFIIL